MSTTLVEKIIIILLSLLISFGLWIYIQINNNPVVSKTYVVPINYNNMTIAGDEFLSYKMTEVTVKIVGRQKVLDNLQADDLEAYVDNSNISGSGAVELPVIIKAKDSGIYFRVELQNPDVIPVFINTTETE